MADTGADAADMGTQVQAYRMSMTALVKKVLPMGGYWCDTTHWATSMNSPSSLLPPSKSEPGPSMSGHGRGIE